MKKSKHGGVFPDKAVIQAKKGSVRWDFEGPINSGYLVHYLHPLFHEHSHRVFGVLLYAISEWYDTDFTG